MKSLLLKKRKRIMKSYKVSRTMKTSRKDKRSPSNLFRTVISLKLQKKSIKCYSKWGKPKAELSIKIKIILDTLEFLSQTLEVITKLMFYLRLKMQVNQKIYFCLSLWTMRINQNQAGNNHWTSGMLTIGLLVYQE